MSLLWYLNEPISAANPTAGLSGFILCAWFALYNYDLYRRFIGSTLPLAARS